MDSTEPQTRTRERLKLAGNVAFGVLVIFFVGSALIYAGLRIYGVEFYEIQSPSMEPAFATGDVVAVKKVAPHEIQAGDVIAFTASFRPEPILHRVSRVQSDPDFQKLFARADGTIFREEWTYSPRTFWTKGDANNAEDPGSITSSAVIGKKLFVVPFPFNLMVTLVSEQTLFVLGVCAIVLYVLLEAVDIVRTAARKRASTAGTHG